MANAGRILIMPKGDWAVETTYESLDLVRHNGTSWLAKKTSVGIEPSDITEEYWQNVFDNAYTPITTLRSNKYIDAQYTISGHLCLIYFGNATEELETGTKYLVGSIPVPNMVVFNAEYTMNGRKWAVTVETSFVYIECKGGSEFPEGNKPNLGFVVPIIVM